VIKILREKLFEEELHWTAGIDFQVVAFQAVNADNVNGDTLHHALGLQPFCAKQNSSGSNGRKKRS
jgi:hypothetical protein